MFLPQKHDCHFAKYFFLYSGELIYFTTLKENFFLDEKPFTLNNSLAFNFYEEKIPLLTKYGIAFNIFPCIKSKI